MDSNTFKNPPPEYRSAPFWSWNDDLDMPELRRQLQEIKKGGYGGAFIHSRVGLVTPYLSDKWMDCAAESLKLAKKMNIPIYLYDEDRWPSGFAGGLVKDRKKHAMKLLRLTKSGKKITKHQVEDLAPIPWFNDTSYLDTMNAEAVAAFIESTYEAYRKRFGSDFGKAIPAIFTDETNYAFTFYDQKYKENPYLPWTRDFDQIFRKTYGYDILDNLICLIEPESNYRKIRYDFYRLLTELLVTNYGKQIYDWCDRNGIAYTGHYLMEDTLLSQVMAIGAAMPFYEHMHIPGVDHLGMQIEDIYLTNKQCSSVCHQFGRNRMLSELFGTSGQNMSFLERKWLGNWDTVLGVNLYCPHLWLYSMAGCRKRDYPPTLSYQQPWWEYNSIIEDYFGRINYAASAGEFMADIAVLHPIESVWCYYAPGTSRVVNRINDTLASVNERVNRLQGSLVSLLRSLSDNHYDYDLCDESILEKYGSVEGTQLAVGKMKYRALIIPEIETIRYTTLDLLRKFVSSGGLVIALGKPPELVNGLCSDEPAEIYREIKVVKNVKELNALVEKSVPRRVSITDGKGAQVKEIYHQQRILGGEEIFLLINSSISRELSADISVPAQRGDRLEHWDPETGRITRLGAKFKGSWLACRLRFPPAGSHIIVKTGKSPGIKLEKYSDIDPGRLKPVMKLPSSSWRCVRKGMNALTIDYCSLRKPKQRKYSKRQYVIDAQKECEKELKDGDAISVKYSCATRLEKRPKNFYLVIEHPENYRISVNGKPVKSKDAGWWADTAFRKVDIRDHLVLRGENTIELETRYKNPKKPKTLIFVKGGTEIESIYLLGNFNVAGKFRHLKGALLGRGFVVTDSSSPKPNDITASGYPFYAGEFVFEQEFEWNGRSAKKVCLKTNVMTPVTMKISINGKPVEVLVWPPYIADIGSRLKKGKNLLSLEIKSSLRNLLGPHHNRIMKPAFTGPGTFNDKKNWIDDYTFADFGLGGFTLMAER